eukprot:s4885_g1.t1
MAQPGGDVEPSLPSLESLPGYSRLPCNQCLFFASSFGCKKGDACAFCHHYVSATQANIPAQRPKNTRRRKFQDDVQQLLLQLNVEQQGPMNVVVQLQIMAQRNRYLRVLCQTGVDDLLWELEQTRPDQKRPGVTVPTVPAHNDSRRPGRCGALHCFSL